MKKVKIIDYINKVAPFDKRVSGDNIGELIKGKDNIRRVMICLDISKEAIAFASSSKVDLIVTHHPVLYNPLFRIDDDVILAAIRNKIGIISAHTNYDAARLNDVLAEKCEVSVIGNIFLEDGIYLGRIGNTAKISFYDYLDKIKTNLKVDTVKITGKIPHDVEKVAIGTGSSSSFIEEIKYLDVDVFITGEIKYDNLKSLAFEKPAVIELGHYESEECFIDDLSNLLSKRFPKLDVITYKKRISIYI